MIVLDCEQGSVEWEQARLGIPTGSQANRLLTPKQLKPSAQANTYRHQLLAEWMLGYAVDWTGASDWMERGQAMEGDARTWYEFQHDVEVDTVGFVLRDDERFGGSPDGLIGDDGGLEIKVPALHTHVGYLLKEDVGYYGQVQAYLYLTERDWWDMMSYSTELPPVVQRVERDPDYITAFDEVLGQFLEDLDAAKDRLAQYRHEIEGVAA